MSVSGNTAELLSELADVTRERVDRRKQVEAERASTRMDMRIIVGVCAVAVVSIILFARSEFLEPYRSVTGQARPRRHLRRVHRRRRVGTTPRHLPAAATVPHHQEPAMILPLTFGAIVGFGLWLIVLAVVPNRDSLATVIARLHRSSPLTAEDVHGLGGRLVARFGPDRFVRTPQRRADLAVLDRPVEVYAAHLATAAIVGAAIPLVAATIVRAFGVRLGIIVPIWAVLIGAAIGVALVVVNVKEEAETERTALRHQLGAYLDVLAMLLTAAEADEQALSLAAHAGDGRLFRRLQRAYRDAAIAGQPLLTGMRRLGDEWGLVELIEIADAGSLAASDGAAVRRTLTAKARAMRAAQLSAEETDARLRTNKLGLPQILLALGFLVLIMYPAFAGLLDNLNP